jgi:hypothetical protein
VKLARRRFLHLAAGVVALPALTTDAHAQSYPTRPINMIVPIGAGSVTDVAGRFVAERMRVSLGQPILIENVSGGDGNIGTARAARAKSDGYTIILGFTSSHCREDPLADQSTTSPSGITPTLAVMLRCGILCCGPQPAEKSPQRHLARDANGPLAKRALRCYYLLHDLREDINEDLASSCCYVTKSVMWPRGSQRRFV